VAERHRETGVSLSVVIAGGGTGGHLYPGIAVARELLVRVPGARVTFVGTAAGIESRVVPREGFALDLIRSAGLKGKSLGSLVRGIGLLPMSAADAWRVITTRRPSIVIGVGGYSSGPVVALAAARGIPTLLMEQNAMPGLTNRLLAPFAGAAAVAYDDALRYFGAKAFMSGNPVRPEFFESGGVREDAGHPSPGTRVLIFGGSQGSHAINVAMVEAAPSLASATPRVAITHQTGDGDLEMVKAGYRRAGLDARVESFLFQMDQEMAVADVVVSRAGATTLSELAASGRASILIPLPTATDDHQRKNANALVRQGAASIVEQRELNGGRLAAEILALVQDAPRRAAMCRAVRRLARPDAAKVIAEKVVALAG
jgi:UDP-N-acetylglucosamine--N-acetylmuramyl-(pentapeptide) pyrophosphoryl-undecaprenol N-acetylglucosamine transferase